MRVESGGYVDRSDKTVQFILNFLHWPVVHREFFEENNWLFFGKIKKFIQKCKQYTEHLSIAPVQPSALVNKMGYAEEVKTEEQEQ